MGIPRLHVNTLRTYMNLLAVRTRALDSYIPNPLSFVWGLGNPVILQKYQSFDQRLINESSNLYEIMNHCENILNTVVCMGIFLNKDRFDKFFIKHTILNWNRLIYCSDKLIHLRNTLHVKHL